MLMHIGLRALKGILPVGSTFQGHGRPASQTACDQSHGLRSPGPACTETVSCRASCRFKGFRF